MQSQESFLPKPKPISQFKLQMIGNQLCLAPEAKETSSHAKETGPKGPLGQAVTNFLSFLENNYKGIIISNKGISQTYQTFYFTLLMGKSGLKLLETTYDETKESLYIFKDYELTVNHKKLNSPDVYTFVKKLDKIAMYSLENKAKIFGKRI
jgi:hypothetical protein